MYFPDRKQWISPDRYGFETGEGNFKEIFLTTEDAVRIQVWFFKQINSKSVPTLLFCHSNAGNLSHRLPNIRDLFHNLGINILIVSYRGYGKSQGSPSESGIKLDMDACMKWLLNEPSIDPEKIICFGRSLGGAVAIDTVYRYPKNIKGLILENTFTSIPDMVDIVLPEFKYFKRLCINNWDSHTRIKSITCPILFLSAKKDEVVPQSHMTCLEKQASNASTKNMIVFESGRHMDLTSQHNYYKYFKDFVYQNVFPPNSQNS